MIARESSQVDWMQISSQNSATDCKQTCFPDKSASSATLWQFICYLAISRMFYLLFKFNHLPLRLPLFAEELFLLLLQPPPDSLLVLHDPVQGVPLLPHRLPLAPLPRVEQTLHVGARVAEYFPERAEAVVPWQCEASLSLVFTQAASCPISSDILYAVKI